MKNFYVTTAIPYVNAAPHVGHALEFVQGDVIARYHRMLGEDTVFLSGGDENALKNVQAAEDVGEKAQEFVDRNSAAFEELAGDLRVEFDVFQKGSSKQHHESSQKLWEQCAQNGDIYKKSYTGLYCVGCEAFYEKGELVEGECPEHPGKRLEEVSEENYFFRLSKYQGDIERLLENNEIKIVPESRKNEVLSFVKRGLEDISISRSNERAKNWGVKVPGDESQRMYVWFDALNIYQSGVGFGWDEDMYERTWPADVHVIGKGITRFHAVYWPAFLLSAGLKLPKTIFVHGYFTVDGAKMSKSVGNVVDPREMVEEFGVDALRYYFLREIPSTSDGDFSKRRLREVYMADLANGLGNLVSRVAKMAQTTEGYRFVIDESHRNSLWDDVVIELDNFRFDKALSVIWGNVKGIDKYLAQERPWQLNLSDENQKLSKYTILTTSIQNILDIEYCLRPFLPSTSEKIKEQFSKEQISSAPALFPRLE